MSFSFYTVRDDDSRGTKHGVVQWQSTGRQETLQKVREDVVKNLQRYDG